MKLLFAVFALACLLVACGDPDGTSPTSTPDGSISSGVRGIVLIGPSCPVVQAGTPCPDKPWQGVVVAQDIAGHEVARTMTDTEGRFSFALVPGDYVLVTVTTGVIPAPIELPVSVAAGSVIEVELLLDSGIR